MQQNYCLVNTQTNVCENIVLWDGDTQTWQPPADCIALVQSSTPAKVWVFSNGAWALDIVVGQGQIGFTWDGTYLVTDEPEPAPVEPVVQPDVVGAQTL